MSADNTRNICGNLIGASTVTVWACYAAMTLGCPLPHEQLREGIVTKMVHIPAKDTVELRTQLNFEGDMETVWTDVHYPAEWWIHIEGAIGDGAEKTTRKLQVSKSLYDKTSIGGYFRLGNQDPYTEEMHLQD